MCRAAIFRGLRTTLHSGGLTQASGTGVEGQAVHLVRLVGLVPARGTVARLQLNELAVLNVGSTLAAPSARIPRVCAGKGETFFLFTVATIKKECVHES
jgi:hypothetical protein